MTRCFIEDEMKFIDFKRAYPMYVEPRWMMTDWREGAPNRSAMSLEEYDRRVQSVLGFVPPAPAAAKL